jgi:hypothetical protein
MHGKAAAALRLLYIFFGSIDQGGGEKTAFQDGIMSKRGYFGTREKAQRQHSETKAFKGGTFSIELSETLPKLVPFPTYICHDTRCTFVNAAALTKVQRTTSSEVDD